MERTGKTVNNFPVALPPIDSDMANQIFKDPFLFDFLGTDMPIAELVFQTTDGNDIYAILTAIGKVARSC